MDGTSEDIISEWLHTGYDLRDFRHGIHEMGSVEYNC